MPNVYLDTNVYIIGILFPDSNSGIILDNMEREDFVVIQSDYLLDEILLWFRRNKGKQSVGQVRTMLASIPNRKLAKMKISNYIHFFSPMSFLRDILKLKPVETEYEV